MHGLLLRSALLRPWVVLAMLLASACYDRELGDDPIDDPPAEHPPELLERYAQACEDRCALYEDCAQRTVPCSCRDRDFDTQHVLCVEKTTLRYECELELDCEEFDIGNMLPPQDDLCAGHRVAETAACR